MRASPLMALVTSPALPVLSYSCARLELAELQVLSEQ